MRILGQTNLQVTEIGCGGIPLQRLKQEEVDLMITSLLEHKINFIDTARGYSCSEQLIGQALRGKREHFIIATKSMARTYEAMKKDIDTSLNNLQTNYLDLYQLHNVSLGEDYQGALQALKEAQAAQKIRHLGITSHSLQLLEEVLDLEIFSTIQFPYNIIETEAEALFKKAYNKNVGVIVMKPLAGGAISNGPLALKFILCNPHVSVVIPGMDSIEQINENMSVLLSPDLPESRLDQEEILKIRQELGNDFCRRCRYCEPCPAGINIAMTFLCLGYFQRYHLQKWAVERYQSMKNKASSCLECGKCEQLCPYQLRIRTKLKLAVKLLEEKND